MGTQRVVGTKQYYTMQLATQNKVVGKETSDHVFDHRLRTVNR